MKTLLKTKLYKPQYNDSLIRRHRLVDLLNQGLSKRLTLVSAPAGFGKTTSISEWISQNEIPFGWISLDENDNDPGMFLPYLVASLRSMEIEVNPETVQMLQSPGQDQIEAILNGLINQIADTQVQFGVVLDDYHNIQNKEVHQIVVYLLDHLPPQVHIVIATRADPPLPIARLRARGQLAEIREADLRFNLSEGFKFLNEIYFLELQPDDVQRLVSRTDGWIAGLQLASIALRGRQDATEFIQHFSGSHDYIVDFLTTEVLEQQQEHIQLFLLRTSVLKRLSAPLCEALTGRMDCHQILKDLRTNNIFLQALDDEHKWYTYHLLFRDLLTQKLMEYHPDEIHVLCQKASSWCEKHGYLNDAIDYAFKGNHIQRAISLVEMLAEATLARSEIATFIGWMRKLPDESIFENEFLCIYYAWALLVSAEDSQTARVYLDQVISSDIAVRGQLNAVQAILAFYQKEIPQAMDLARQALIDLPEDDFFFRQIAAWNLSASLFISGDRDGGARILAEVARVSLGSKNFVVAVVALCRLGSYQFQLGDLYHAKDLFEQALEIASVDQKHLLPVACEAMLGLGKVYWEWGQHESAKEYLLNGIELSKKWREITSIEFSIILAHLYQYLGDPVQANQMIKIAHETAVKNVSTDTDDKFTASEEALIQLRQGNIKAAKYWANTRGLERYLQDNDLSSEPKLGVDIILRYELLVYARILIFQKKTDAVLQLMSIILPSLELLGHRLKLVEAHLVVALGWQVQGKTGKAIVSLRRALSLAQVGGFVRVFLDEGYEIINLIKMVNAQGDYLELTQRIMHAYTGVNASSVQLDQTSNLIDLLSTREVEILRWLESDLPVPDISADLHISVSTLRTHIRNIYRKLDCHSRFEAVSKAKDLKII